MAFDGIVIASLVHELNQTVLNSKISKIAQPENDELLLTCKGSNGQFRVAISASASLPFLYLTESTDCSDFLYGAAQAYCKRAHHTHLPTAYGANHQYGDRAPERNG